MIAMADIVGANAERSRSHNRQVVLGRIRAAGQIGRAQIARGSGLSTQAVSNIIAGLLDEGMIVELGRLSGSRGLPAVQYGLNPEGGYAVGIEIRPDAIFGAVLDLCGKPLASERRDLTVTDLQSTTDAVLSVRAAISDAAGIAEDRVLGAGIVMPGPFGGASLGGSGSELPIWQNTPPAPWFSEALSLPVIVENDANAAAVAERVSGVARDLESYAYLYFGSGLGLGIIQNGRLITGAFGNAGEIGHIPVPFSDGAVTLETAVSRLSIRAHLAKFGIDASTGESIERAYCAGEPALLDWLEAAAEPLSAAITIVENILDPEAVILGGAMPDAILDHFIKSVSLADSSVSNRQQRSTSRLLRGASGRLTATLGGAALVINRTFTPQITAVS